MSGITERLARVHKGEGDALGRVFAALYDKLRRPAKNRLDHGQKTLSPTAQIQEAYLRLVGKTSARSIKQPCYFQRLPRSANSPAAPPRGRN